jgi:hypothetical protein
MVLQEEGGWAAEAARSKERGHSPEAIRALGHSDAEIKRKAGG